MCGRSLEGGVEGGGATNPLKTKSSELYTKVRPYRRRNLANNTWWGEGGC
jgi:hypothetical protein